MHLRCKIGLEGMLLMFAGRFLLQRGDIDWQVVLIYIGASLRKWQKLSKRDMRF